MQGLTLLLLLALGVHASSHQQPHGRVAHVQRAAVLRRSESVKHERRKCAARNAKASTKSKSSKSSKSSSASKSAKTKSGNSTSTSSSSSSISNSFIKLNGIGVGMVPDEGDAGGSKQSMAQLNAAAGGKFATYGYYAQAQSGTKFDGSQLLAVKDDVVKSGAILEAAVMPTGGFNGYDSSDNSQSTAICNVMKEFTDAGVETRLRFAHECNFYITDGTYSGSLADCKSSFTNVAQTCRKIAPKVKMFLTPNIDGNGLSTYKQMFPDDASLVDLVGIDFYPKSVDSTTFVDAHKPFHDFAVGQNSKIQYAIGETGLAQEESIQDRLAWLQQMTNAATKKAMPKLVSVSWFNFDKGFDFKIVDTSSSSSETSAFKALSGMTGL